MKVELLEPAFQDHRGAIIDLIMGQSVQHVALFTCKMGTARGNHYHKESTSYIFVLNGRFQVRWRGARGPVQVLVAKKGDLLTVNPQERHELTALEDASFLMITRGPNGGRQFERDTVREAV